MGIFSVPLTHITTLPILAQQVHQYLGEVSMDTVAIVSPDQGGIERTRTFGSALFGTPDFDLVVVEKRRDQNKIHTSGAVQLYGDVKGKAVVIVDDVTTSGGTLIHAAEACMQAGATKAVSAIAHHDLGTSAPQKIQNSPIEKLFTTNTIKLTDEMKFDKLHEVSIASLLAQSIK